MRKGFVLAALQRSEEALRYSTKTHPAPAGTAQNYIGRAQILIALKRKMRIDGDRQSDHDGPETGRRMEHKSLFAVPDEKVR